MTCTAPDCDREAKRRGLCDGHRWQREHGRALTPLEPRGQDPRDRLTEAALAYADAESDAEVERARARLETAARAFTLESPACHHAGCDRRVYREGLCFLHYQHHGPHPRQGGFGFLVPDVPGSRRIRLPARRKLRDW